MTVLLDKAVAAARSLPPEAQDEIARVVLALAEDGSSEAYELTAEEDVDLAESDAETARGELATDDQMRAIWAKHGR